MLLLLCCRSDKDVVMAAAYEWYVQQFQPGNHLKALGTRDGLIHLGDVMAGRAAFAAVADHHPPQVEGPHNGSRLHVRRSFHPVVSGSPIIHEAVAAAVQAARAGMPGARMLLIEREAFFTLNRDWSRPGARVVCLNDDINQGFEFVRPLLNPMVRRFLGSRYTVPSQYELWRYPGRYPGRHTCR